MPRSVRPGRIRTPPPNCDYLQNSTDRGSQPAKEFPLLRVGPRRAELQHLSIGADPLSDWDLYHLGPSQSARATVEDALRYGIWTDVHEPSGLYSAMRVAKLTVSFPKSF